MAVEIGTAANHQDLLDKLIAFITTDPGLVALGQNWQLIKEQVTPKRSINGGPTTNATMSDYREVFLRGPGLGNQDEIYCNILAYSDPAVPINNWRIFGATSYDDVYDIEYQPGSAFLSPGSTTYPTYFVSSGALMDYWLVANGRRFHMVVKIEGDFYYLYMGLVLPYGKPSEIAYPLLIAGNTITFTETPASIALYNVCSPGTTPNARHAFRAENGRWCYVGGNQGNSGGIPYLQIHPWSVFKTQGANEFTPVGAPDGSFPIFPAMFWSTYVGYRGVYGEIQGIFYVPKIGNVDLNSEDTLTIDGLTYLVFQNVDKNSRFDYAAMQLL